MRNVEPGILDYEKQAFNHNRNQAVNLSKVAIACYRGESKLLLDAVKRHLEAVGDIEISITNWWVCRARKHRPKNVSIKELPSIFGLELASNLWWTSTMLYLVEDEVHIN